MKHFISTQLWSDPVALAPKISPSINYALDSFRHLQLYSMVRLLFGRFFFCLFSSHNFCSLLQFIIGQVKADWGSADSSQYHIQTDEGPERFFRYQTDSGQFRNEKRLKDGTVIGKSQIIWITQ